MGDCLHLGKAFLYVTSHPGQLSLSTFMGCSTEYQLSGWIIAIVFLINKLTFDPPTRLHELTENLIRSSHGHFTPSLKISYKSVQPFSRNVADKETKKERKKQIARKQYPVGGGVTSENARVSVVMLLFCQIRQIQNSGVVGLAVEGSQIGRNGQLSLMQVNAVMRTVR